VAAAPSPPAPTNLVKVSIVRNGEAKEYTVMKSDESRTDERRASRAGLPPN
jgi:hypothetical protein